MSREVKRFVKPLKLYFAGYQLKFSLINQSLLSPKKPRKLMDFAREESSWPRVKNAEQLPTLKSFYPVSQLPKKTSRQYSKIRKCKANLFCSPLFLLFVNLKSCVRSQDFEQSKNLLQAIVEQAWYLSPHSEKLKNLGASLPTFFPRLLNLMIRYVTSIK